ncbi:hypothetical protein DS275_21725 [Salmonella enterica subsp. salamae serovar Sofia]|nr:hypothetical protein [Salmonella enterica subsp. salamae serovar Sofia]
MLGGADNSNGELQSYIIGANTRTQHRTVRVENHQATSHRDGAAIKAEPATSFSASESPADKRRGFPLPSLT